MFSTCSVRMESHKMMWQWNSTLTIFTWTRKLKVGICWLILKEEFSLGRLKMCIMFQLRSTAWTGSRALIGLWIQRKNSSLIQIRSIFLKENKLRFHSLEHCSTKTHLALWSTVIKLLLSEIALIKLCSLRKMGLRMEWSWSKGLKMERTLSSCISWIFRLH